MRRTLGLVLTIMAACGGDGGGAGRDDAGPGSGSGSGTPDASVPPPKRVRFVAFGDAGKGNTAQRDVAVAIRNTCAAKGCDFALMLGDNIYDAGVDSVTDPQWQTKFEVPDADVDRPFYVALGNHDYGGRLIYDSQGMVDYTYTFTRPL